MTDEGVVRMQLAQAYSRSVNPETREHLRAALRELDDTPTEQLAECPECGRLGTLERIAADDCRR
jgi:plasmid stability protein